MKLARLSSTIRRWSRNLHRELSFFFAGIVLIYAVSGFLLNHKGDFNAEYDIVNREFRIDDFPAARSEIDKEYVRSILEPLGEAANYTKHYFPEESRMKVFLKGGSSLTVDTESGVAVYESVRKRPLWSALNRLHYNPGRWWTLFSDIFAFSLIVITLTGVIMLKGPKGFWGRGGVEMLAGILVPVLFLMLM